MELVVASQNVERGALKTGSGLPEDRWPALADALRSLDADILLIQEAEGWAADGARQLVRAEQDLEMDGILTPPASGLGPALLYRRSTLGRRTYENSDHGERETHHGCCVVGWNLPDLPAPLLASSWHMTPYDAVKAASEANFLATRLYKAGPYAIGGGDVNYAPQDGPGPDPSGMRPYNRGARLLPGSSSGPAEPDRRVAQTLADNGLVDVARHWHRVSGDETALSATAGGDRIDQLWVSAALAPCITGYGLLHHGASDHAAVWTRLDLSQAKTTDVWEYA